MKTATVLVVDDDPSIIAFLTAALDDEGYRVLTATGAAALTLARTQRPAVILLDIMMPGMNGLEVSRRLRADPATATIPIIAMSAHAGSSTSILDMHADDHLPKPFKLAQLYRAVARWTQAQPQRDLP